MSAIIGTKGVLEKISISNRFENLIEDTRLPIIAEQVVQKDNGKKNAEPENETDTEKSVEEVTTMIFTAGTKHNEQMSQKNTAVTHKIGNKGPGKIGGKPKQIKVTGPVRGLVFGLSTKDITFSSSGKRLRVETPTNGKLGGGYAVNHGSMELHESTETSDKQQDASQMESEDFPQELKLAEYEKSSGTPSANASD